MISEHFLHPSKCHNYHQPLPMPARSDFPYPLSQFLAVTLHSILYRFDEFGYIIEVETYKYSPMCLFVFISLSGFLRPIPLIIYTDTFLWMNSIPLSACVTFCIFIHQSLDVWKVSLFLALRIMLL